ncbi:hypothetical protein LRC484719_38520 [Mycobacterium riyadhense]
MNGCVAGRGTNLAKKHFDIASAMSWFEQLHTHRHIDVRWNPAAGQVGDQNACAVGSFADRPSQAWFLPGYCVCEPLQPRASGRGGRSLPGYRGVAGSGECLFSHSCRRL